MPSPHGHRPATRTSRLLARLRHPMGHGVPSPTADSPPPVATPAVAAAPARASLPAPDLIQLEAEARHSRDRFALYRARALSAKPTDETRMRELERASEAAGARLAHAKRR